MGQMTPDGVTEIQTSPQEQNPAAGFDVAPDPAISEFFNTLDNAVQEDPAAEDAIDLLIREIQETTGLYTDNPDMQAQAASRFEQLNSAIQDSNMPEEIKAAFNNIYTTSIDSPQYLNVLNGFIMQGGGSIAGIAGAAQRLEDERLAKRNEADNRAAAAGTAAMISTMQKKINDDLDDFFNKNAKAIAEAATAACATEKNQGSEAAAREYTDKLSPLQLEALDTFKKDNPDATEQDIRQFIDGMAEGNAEQLTTAGASTETADLAEEITREQLLSRAGLLDKNLTNNRNQSISRGENNNDLITEFFKSAALGSSIGASIGANIGTMEPGASSIQTKEDLVEFIDARFEASTNQLAEQRLALEETKAEYRALEEDMNGFFGQFQSILGFNDEDKEMMEQMKIDIAQQEQVLSLQEDINGLMKVEAEKFLNNIDDPSDIDLNLLKQAYLDMDPELATKTAQLNELLGLEDSNPIAQMQAMLEDQGVELTEEQRADLTNFIAEVTEKRTALTEAEQEFARQAEAALTTTPDGILMPQNQDWGGVPSVVSPEARVDYAYNEMVKKQQELEDYTREQGVSIKEETAQKEAPAPAPEEPSHMDVRAAEMAQELAAKGNVTRADLEQMVYNDNWIGPMQDQMEAKLETELRAINPDFEFAEMSVEDQIVMAFIENEGTLSQQDIELIISESGIDGAQFQTTVDAMVTKFDNHEAFSIDPPVGSAAAQYAPDLAAASEEPAPAETNEPEQDQAQQPEPEEQEYAHNQATQNPALY